MCLGMALAYLGAFHQPEPHHLKVAVVGTGPQAKVLAQTVKDAAGDRLDVTTLRSSHDAQRQLLDRDLVGAFLPDATSPELLVATANSDTSTTAAEAVFQQVTAEQGTRLKVSDLAPSAPGDPTGQGLFFLLIALSIGSYAGVAVIGGAGAVLPMRVRALVALAASLAISAIGIVVAGPVFHIVDHDRPAMWAISWLYSAGILAIGTGLHTFVKRWTTLTMMVLFVMVNFTSSGGVFRPDLQNGFFGALHAFWNGAGFVEGARSLLYFDGRAGLSGNLLALALWLAAGLALLIAAGRSEQRHRGAELVSTDDDIEEEVEENMEEAVGV
ncbi:hypothetical protein DY245_01800 [Streptomyces inhibens]|uniref:ABC transporter permease n=1 Tax=Streptomyces inhibens TaxID=2293571 RepID=A0A371QB84_STRIH|nr:hypothetical protein [Streptomyces inhibens]REK91925.1 hypothetical protein DY245_01800 [Streptomyces inhibens]